MGTPFTVIYSNNPRYKASYSAVEYLQGLGNKIAYELGFVIVPNFLDPEVEIHSSDDRPIIYFASSMKNAVETHFAIRIKDALRWDNGIPAYRPDVNMELPYWKKLEQYLGTSLTQVSFKA